MGAGAIIGLFVIGGLWSLILLAIGFVAGSYYGNNEKLHVDKIVEKVRQVFAKPEVKSAGIKPPSPAQLRLMRNPEEQALLERQKELLS